MAERAADLLDRVFPDVPVRRWVLTLPYRLRLDAFAIGAESPAELQDLLKRIPAASVRD